MQALRLETSAGGSLHTRQLPIPTPGPGQALLKVEAAGLCHSDTTILAGAGSSFIHGTPITLGHEVAGTVVALGPSPSSPPPFQAGERVAVALISHPIEHARWSSAIGLGFDGGYAQYALAPVANLVRVPAGVGFAQAAVATDSIATAYHAVRGEGRVGAGMTVAVVGLGGLGMNGVVVAALQGASVYGVDVNAGKLEDARRCGAVGAAASLEELKGVEFDVVVDFVGKRATVAAAVSAVRKGGRVVLVGLGDAVGEFPIARLVTRGITLKGSIGASKEELVSVLDLIATGKIAPKLQEIPFADVEKGLKSLDGNEVSGRLFTCPNKGFVSTNTV